MIASSIGFNPTYHEQAPTVDQVKNLKGFSILEFGAPWCGHCKAAAAATQAGLSDLKLPHIKIYDGKGKKLGRSFGVKLWPTLILLESGEEVGRLIRPVDLDEVEKFLAPVRGEAAEN